MICIAAIIAIEKFLGFYESKYVFILSFGYVLHCIWQKARPSENLKNVWTVLMPFLFGTVGASIRIDELKLDHLWKGFILFNFGFLLRFIGTFLCGILRRYKMREALFCAIAWMPKATVQAAIGGLFLDRVRLEMADSSEFSSYEDYGGLILTTSIIAILISAPMGGILTKTLGPKLLLKES